MACNPSSSADFRLRGSSGGGGGVGGGVDGGGVDGGGGPGADLFLLSRQPHTPATYESSRLNFCAIFGGQFFDPRN